MKTPQTLLKLLKFNYIINSKKIFISNNPLTRRLDRIEYIIKQLKNYIFYSRVPNYEKLMSPQEYISEAIQCAELHKRAFADKRGINFGKDVVVCATGPTFDCFTPVIDAYYIGVNNAYKSKNINFDVLFCQDVYTCFQGIPPKDFIEYRGKDCIKFLGNQQPVTVNADIRNNVFYYNSENKFNFHVDLRPMPDFCSVIFSAMSYALWTTPKRIFLVGADCSSGHASSLKAKHHGDLNYLLKPWKSMANFIKNKYPDIEIISINPIGLKGLFNKDIYTNEFLQNHKLFDENIKILMSNGEIK